MKKTLKLISLPTRFTNRSSSRIQQVYNFQMSRRQASTLGDSEEEQHVAKKMRFDHQQQQDDTVQIEQQPLETEQTTQNTKFETPTENDIAIIKKQLQKNSIAQPSHILKRCKWGFPQVTFARPGKAKGTKHYQTSKEILPGTFVWLTCPRIRNVVSKLESGDPSIDQEEEFTSVRLMFEATVNHESQIEKKKKALESDIAVEKKEGLLQQSHVNYENWLVESNLLTKDELAQWKSGNRVQTEEEYINGNHKQVRFSNAGMSSDTAIKCLHAHIGPYLAGAEDFVGKEVFERCKGVVQKMERDIEDLDAPLDCKSNCIECNKFSA